MFHEREFPVEDPSSSAANQQENSTSFARSAVILVGIALIILLLWLLGVFQNDPYIKETLSLEGSSANGERLFRVNCVGCHGISAKGLLGPDLHEVSENLSQKQIINQVMQGRTPPMPSFQMDPQKMADLLAYLDSLN